MKNSINIIWSTAKALTAGMCVPTLLISTEVSPLPLLCASTDSEALSLSQG